MSKRKFFLLITLLLSSLIGNGQGIGKDTALKGSVIEVIQSYKPQVRQAPKPEWLPQLPPLDTFHRVFTYVVPQQSLYYLYHSEPLKPLALGKDTIATPMPNYVKLGIGNLSTLYIDAGLGSYIKPEYETFFHLHHISQSSGNSFQQNSISGLDAEGKWHQNNNEWRATYTGLYNQFYYYGYNHSEYHYTKGDSLRQGFTTLRAVIDYKVKDMGDSKLDYHPAVNFSYYGARFNTHESALGFNIPVTYDYDTNLQMQVGIYGNFAQFKTDSPYMYNNLFKITPGISGYNQQIKWHANLGLAVNNNGKTLILPDVEGSSMIPGSELKFRLGWLSSLNQNTYEQLTTENPYIFNTYKISQTRKDELFANVSGSFGEFHFAGQASWQALNALPTYLDTIGDQKQFSILYDDVKAISLQLGAKYIMSKIYTVGLSGEMLDYYQGTSKYPWQLPNLKIKGDFAIVPIQFLTITAYLSLLSGAHAIDANKNVVALKTILDFGGNAEYQFNSRYCAFLQASNLLNNNYQQWQGYGAYGINIYGGIRFKF